MSENTNPIGSLNFVADSYTKSGDFQIEGPETLPLRGKISNGDSGIGKSQTQLEEVDINVQYRH